MLLLLAPSGAFCQAQNQPVNHLWAGIYPTVLTPFGQGGVDTGSLKRQIELQLRGGVHGFLVLETLGEGRLVTAQERTQVVSTAVQAAAGRAPIVVGIHSCNFLEARAQLLEAHQLGAAAVLVKYVGNATAAPIEVIRFYTALGDLHALPIFYDHNPAETGLRLPPRDFAHILHLPDVVGIKESTGDLRDLRAHMQLVPDQTKTFLAGSAQNLTQFLALGGHGAMCPEAVLMPDTVVQAYLAYQIGKKDEAQAVQKTLAVLDPLVGNRSGILRTVFQTPADEQPQARMKAALSVMGVPTSPTVKEPLPPLTPADQHRVSQAVWRVRCCDWRDIMRPYPPAPRQRCLCPDRDETGGIILKTGAIQLGRDVGKDMTGWQGDGKAGFWD